MSSGKPAGFFQERPPQVMELAPQLLRHWTRRDVLLFGAGAVAALAGGVSLLPQPTLERLGIIHENKSWPKKEWLLNRSLRIDDDVAEAMYSRNRLVPTYSKAQITPLKNNYNGATPNPSYIPEWVLTLDGLASGSRPLECREENSVVLLRRRGKTLSWYSQPGGKRLTCYL